MSGPAAPLLVREARPDELAPLGHLTVTAYAALLGDVMSDDYEAELGDVAGRAATAVVLVAVGPAGSLLGGVTYLSGPASAASGVWNPASTGEVSLRMLAVTPESQGRGIGTALLRACIDRARGEGRSRIVLHTTRYMATAIRLYERLGFTRAPERDESLPQVQLLAYVLDVSER